MESKEKQSASLEIPCYPLPLIFEPAEANYSNNMVIFIFLFNGELFQNNNEFLNYTTIF